MKFTYLLVRASCMQGSKKVVSFALVQAGVLCKGPECSSRAAAQGGFQAAESGLALQGALQRFWEVQALG